MDCRVRSRSLNASNSSVVTTPPVFGGRISAISLRNAARRSSREASLRFAAYPNPCSIKIITGSKYRKCCCFRNPLSAGNHGFGFADAVAFCGGSAQLATHFDAKNSTSAFLCGTFSPAFGHHNQRLPGPSAALNVQWNVCGLVRNRAAGRMFFRGPVRAYPACRAVDSLPMKEPPPRSIGIGA